MNGYDYEECTGSNTGNRTNIESNVEIGMNHIETPGESNEGSDYCDCNTSATKILDARTTDAYSKSFNEFCDASNDTSCNISKKSLDKSIDIKEPDPRPHLNVVFIGHVDAGKSTTCGNILVLTGQVDLRTLEKYEKEAKERNRESWYYAFIVDVSEEERQRGKTIEVGRAYFNLENTRFTILDAPGHKGFVPYMISGAAQADVAVLILSARIGEFESGFDKGGQTREHAMLAKTLGVSQLIVAVNKMDDSSCNWSEERFLEIESKIKPFLKKCGYNPEKDVTFIPISGMYGHNIKTHVCDIPELQPKASWYTKNSPTLLQILDKIRIPNRDRNGHLRIPLLEGFRDQGVVACGKIERGTVRMNQNAIIMPQGIKVKIAGVLVNNEPVSHCLPGENVTLKMLGIMESQLSPGCVLSSLDYPCPVATVFKAQIIVVNLLEHKPLITLAYSSILHAHTAVQDCQISALHESFDRGTKKKKINPRFVKNNSSVICEIKTSFPLCVEEYDNMPQLGRFTLRDEGKTIAFGKVLKILS